MKLVLTIAGLALCGAAVMPFAQAAEARDADHGDARAFVKDSVITTKIKSKLAAEHLPSLANIHVDTDANGIVVLSGTASTQAQIEQAQQVAGDTEGVRHVRNELTLRPDR
jgi:hyperosmotically inducible protein